MSATPLSQSKPNAERSAGPLARALHLMALCGFAAAQPLFEVLKEGPSFFVARGSQPVDLWLLTIGLSFAPAILLFTTEALAGLISRKLRVALHLFWVALLVGVMLAPVFERVLSLGGFWAAGSALLIGGMTGVVYHRSHLFRSFLDMLSPAPVLFAVLFLLNPSIAKLAMPPDTARSRLQEVAAGKSLVWVILDELPLQSLLSPDGEIDGKLFPNFARLARTSTWFRNATASNSVTVAAVPAMVSGQMPVPLGRLPHEVDYPDTIFTLLGQSYRMRIHESITRLCPRELVGLGEESTGVRQRMGALLDDLSVVYGHVILPEPLRSGLPEVSMGWGDFRGEDEDGGAVSDEVGEVALVDVNEEVNEDEGDPEEVDVVRERITEALGMRAEEVRRFIAEIDLSSEPTFYFLHVLLPHGPWSYLPSGARHRSTKSGIANGGGDWANDEAVTAFGYQRHLLQVGYVDRMLGQLLDRLEEKEVFDDSVIVITADHGISFAPGLHSRKATNSNLADVMHVPLLIKQAGQREAQQIDRNVQSMDLLPTIADALGVEIPWEVEGTSAFDPSAPEIPTKTMYTGNAIGRQALEAEGGFPSSFAAVERKVRLFGPDPDWDAVYALGSARRHIGRRVAEMELAPTVEALALIENDQLFETVDVSTGVSPSYVIGMVESADESLFESEFLLAVNGVLRAQLTLYGPGKGRVRFAAILPDTCFRSGANSVDVFALREDGSLALVPRRGMRYVPASGAEREHFETSDGRIVKIHSNVRWGSLDRVNVMEGYLVLAGTAGSKIRDLVADEVLIVFPDGRVTSAPTGDRRPKAGVDSALYHAGFQTDVFVSDLASPKLRLFARIGKEAAPLGVGRDHRWVRQ